MVPIEVVATVLPLLSVERIAFAIVENHVVPRVVSVAVALVKDCRPVQELALARLSPTVCAVPPLYEPENESEPLVAVRLARFDPRPMPEIVEF